MTFTGDCGARACAETPIFFGPNDILQSYDYVESIYPAADKDSFMFYFAVWMPFASLHGLDEGCRVGETKLDQIPATASQRKEDTV